MKVLHSAAMLAPPSGILSQMNWEQKAAFALKLDWSARMFCPKGFDRDCEIIMESKRVHAHQGESRLKKLSNWISLRQEYHQWLRQQEDQVDLFLLRYYVHDPFQLHFLKTVKKPVVLVHHTLEGPELAMGGGLRARVRSTLDNLLAVPAIRSAAGIVGVTHEILKYEEDRAGGIRTSIYVYPNGVFFDDQETLDDQRGDIPEFLFVAGSFAPWHGLDLLLSLLKNEKADFRLHLIGDVSNPDLRLIDSDPRVIVHGKLIQSEIRKVAASCWGGLSSFALNRKGMKEACTLKVREYLMMGLPVYAGHREVFPSDFPFYQHGPLSIQAMIDFFWQFRSVGRFEIARKSRPFIDKTSLLKKLADELRSDAR